MLDAIPENFFRDTLRKCPGEGSISYPKNSACDSLSIALIGN